MANIPLDVATNLFQKLADRAINEAYYLCCFNNIIADFKNDKQELEAKRQSVQERARLAMDKTENISTDVKHWLKKANNLIDEDTKTKKTCFCGWFPNCIWRYHRGKELERKKEEINNLIQCNIFDNFSLPSEIPDIDYHSSKDFVQFESRDLTYKQLFKALEDHDRYIVGLHGMPGTGKTTLAIEVGKKVKELKLFDHVIKAVVSNTPIVKDIQDQIASPLGLKLEDENELNRAKKLWTRLNNEDNILIILDDVWKDLDFEKIGISPGDKHKSCRVLLTTRNLEVCSSMRCQMTIKLEVLSEPDAWFLFQKCSGLDKNSPKTKKDKGKKIAKLCKALPVAVVAIASTLKDVEAKEWDLTLRSLKRIDHNVDEDLIKVFRRLHLSYDYLKNEEKELFLLCSVFPEDYEIPVEDLTTYGIALGLCGEGNSYSDARDVVHKAKKKLVNSCLLLSVNEGKYVKMHDLVRDAAHWIAKKEIRVVMEPKSLNTLQEDATARSTVRHLYCHNVRDFPDQLDFSKLEILILAWDYHKESVKIPDTFFEGLRGLKVCTLNGYEFSEPRTLFFPKSIESLHNLRTLSLRRWKLVDIFVLEKLQGLDCLELKYCSISELPSEIGRLKKLKLLRLIQCDIEKDPFVVIGQLSQLEELYFIANHLQVDSEAVVISSPLQRYHIDFVKTDELPQSVIDSISRALSVANFDASTSNATIRDLIQRAEVLHLHELQGGCKTITPHFVEAIGEMNELIELKLKSCSEIEFLIDATVLSSAQGTLFSNIVKLSLEAMDQLKEICHGLPPSDLLGNLQELIIQQCFQLNFRLFLGNWNLCRLKILCVRSCPKLTSLFTLSTARSLILLEELEINECKELKYIIAKESDEGKGKGVVDDDHDQRRYSSLFPGLKRLVIENCQQLEHIWSVGSNKRRLLEPIQSLELHAVDWQQSRPLDTAHCLLNQSVKLCHIKKMEIVECEKLISLFSLFIVPTMLLEELKIKSCQGLRHIIIDDSHINDRQILPKLSLLSVENCNKLEYVIGGYHHEKLLSYSEWSALELFPALEQLHLTHMPNIISICQNNHHPRWSTLKRFHLIECPQFTITAISDFMNFSDGSDLIQPASKELEANMKQVHNLNELRVINSKIEGIIYLKGNAVFRQEVSLGIKFLWLNSLPNLRYTFSGPKHIVSLQNLINLVVEECGKLKFIFSATVLGSLPQLKKLFIINCEALKQIVEEDDQNHNLSNPYNFQEVCFPKLECVYIKSCSKLKYLFSMNAPYKFPELKELIIIESSDIEEVFGSSGESETEKQLENALPKLGYLLLVELPNFVNLCRWTELQNVNSRVVLNCPKLSLTSNTTLGWFVFHFRMNTLLLMLESDHYSFYDLLVDEVRRLENSRQKLSIEERENDIVGQVSAPEIPPPTSSLTDLEVTKMPSTTTSTTHLNSIKGSLEEGMNEPISKKELEENKSINETPQKLDGNSDLAPKTSLQSVEGNVEESPMSPKVSMVTFATHDSESESSTLKEQLEKSPEALEETNEIPQRSDKPSNLLQNTFMQEMEGRVSSNNTIITNEQGINGSGQRVSSTDSEPRTLSNSQQEFEGKESMGAPISTEEGALDENKINHESPQIVAIPSDSDLVQNVEEHVSASAPMTILNKTAMAKSLTIPEPKDSSLTPIDASPEETSPLGPMRVSKTETSLDKDTNASSSNLQDLMHGIFSVLNSVEKDGEVQDPMSSISVIPSDRLNLEDQQLLVKAFADLEAYLKMPLKDIANSEVNSHCLENVLKFLSSWSCGNGAPWRGLKPR